MASRLYGRAWQQARRAFLAAHPLCWYCQQAGKVTAATVVDHKIPHKGDESLFWDSANWQPLCKRCHDSVKQAEDRGSGLRGCDTSGRPLDPRHHWSRDERG